MSNYGPKGYKLYDQTQNLERKSRRTSEIIECGPNSAVKPFSTKPGQLSARDQTNLEDKKYSRLNKKQPVRSYRDELKSEGKSDLEISQILFGLVKVG